MNFKHLLRAPVRILYVLNRQLTWKARRLMLLLRLDACAIAGSARIGPGVDIQVTDGGSLSIGPGVNIGAAVRITVRGGSVAIGANSFIGPGTIIVAQERVTLGRDCLVGEYVVLRDQDHTIDTDQLINAAGYRVAPVAVGNNVWLGAKCSVLSGSSIGDGAVVGAHALVRGAIPADWVALGIPAKPVRMRTRPN